MTCPEPELVKKLVIISKVLDGHHLEFGVSLIKDDIESTKMHHMLFARLPMKTSVNLLMLIPMEYALEFLEEAIKAYIEATQIQPSWYRPYGPQENDDMHYGGSTFESKDS